MAGLPTPKLGSFPDALEADNAQVFMAETEEFDKGIKHMQPGAPAGDVEKQVSVWASGRAGAGRYSC